MRAMKRTVSVLLSLMLVLGMMAIGMSAVGAAGTNTITAKSTITSDASQTYTSDSKQVTVTYYFQSAKKLINAEGVLTYDPAVLKPAATTTEQSLVPYLRNISVNLGLSGGRITFNASDPQNPVDFTTKDVFLTITFDIIGTGDTTVNMDIDTITVTNTDGKTRAGDLDVVYDGVVDNTLFTANGEVVVSGGEPGNVVDPSVFLNRYGANLEGKVGLMHVFNKSPEGYDTSKLTVKFIGPDDSVGDASENKTIKYTDMAAAGKKYLRHDYSLKSTMLAQPVTFEIYNNGEFLCRSTYSVMQYALDKPSTDQVTNTLVNALLNYGGYAQLQFGAYTDNLANQNIDSTLTAITADTIVLPAGVGTAPDLSSIGMNYYMEGSELEADTAIRVLLKVTDKTKANAATATWNGANAPIVFTNASGSIREIDLTNISSADFDTIQTVTFSNGKTYKTSVLAQIKKKLTDNEPGSAAYNLATAMYWYNQAANAYFEG